MEKIEKLERIEIFPDKIQKESTNILKEIRRTKSQHKCSELADYTETEIRDKWVFS